MWLLPSPHHPEHTLRRRMAPPQDLQHHRLALWRRKTSTEVPHHHSLVLMPTARSLTEQHLLHSQHARHWSAATPPLRDHPYHHKRRYRCGLCFRHTIRPCLSRNKRTSPHKHHLPICRQVDRPTLLLQSPMYRIAAHPRGLQWLPNRHQRHSSRPHTCLIICGLQPTGKKSRRFRFTR